MGRGPSRPMSPERPQGLWLIRKDPAHDTNGRAVGHRARSTLRVRPACSTASGRAWSGIQTRRGRVPPSVGEGVSDREED